VIHQPDTTIDWRLPPHLQSYVVSGAITTVVTDKFAAILKAVQPYTFLSETQLFSLYSQGQQLYDYFFWLPKILRQTLCRMKSFPSKITGIKVGRATDIQR